MRGKVNQSQEKGKSIRITPAYAGKRSICRMISGGKWDHPRLCGEKKAKEMLRRNYAGSPPPMRGKVFTASTPCVSARITPAYAGKSGSGGGSYSNCEDHPRLCGEKLDIAEAVQEDKGSPPPMRGKDSVTLYRDHVVRITPAYAGKSSCDWFRRSSCWDHPRLCGEKGGSGKPRND